MFQGHSVCTLDSKSRLILPSKFRKTIKPEAENKLVITRGVDDCLLMYPQDIWEKVRTGLTSYNLFDSNHRVFLREFMMYVHEVELDSQFRIVLPQQLKDFAKIDTEVIIVGLLDKMEIWSPTVKEMFDKFQKTNYAEIAQKVSSLLDGNSINH